MERLIVFTDEMQFIPPLLVPELLACLGRRDDVELVAVCVPRRLAETDLLWAWGKRRLERRLQRMFSGGGSPWPWPDPLWLRKLSRGHGFPLLSPAGGNFADAAFFAMLEETVRPTLMINCYCLTKFSPRLLGLVAVAINYHNGRLPEYRGVRATHLSVYHGDNTTGYVFHHMTEGLDEGPVLVAGDIPVTPEQTVFDLEHAKAAAAARRFPELLTSMVARDPGRPQQGVPRVFSRRDWRAIRTIESPQDVDAEEVLRRLKAFSVLKILINGCWHDVTALDVQPDGSGARSFQTADGVWLRPVRYGFLPYLLYMPLRRPVWSRR